MLRHRLNDKAHVFSISLIITSVLDRSCTLEDSLAYSYSKLLKR